MRYIDVSIDAADQYPVTPYDVPIMRKEVALTKVSKIQ